MKSTIKIDLDEKGLPFLNIFLSSDTSDVRDKLLYRFLYPAENNSNSFFIASNIDCHRVNVGAGSEIKIYPTNGIMITHDGKDAMCGVMSQTEWNNWVRDLTLANSEPIPETE